MRALVAKRRGPRETPYVLLLLFGCLLYGSALGVLVAEWAVRR
jgi:hypothetical protein